MISVSASLRSYGRALLVSAAYWIANAILVATGALLVWRLWT